MRSDALERHSDVFCHFWLFRSFYSIRLKARRTPSARYSRCLPSIIANDGYGHIWILHRGGEWHVGLYDTTLNDTVRLDQYNVVIHSGDSRLQI